MLHCGLGTDTVAVLLASEATMSLSAVSYIAGEFAFMRFSHDQLNVAEYQVCWWDISTLACQQYLLPLFCVTHHLIATCHTLQHA